MSKWPYVAMLVALLTFLGFLPGCGYCQVATNVSTPQCKAELAVRKCGPKAMAIVAEAVPFIIAQDWASLFSVVGGQAPDEWDCIKNTLEKMVGEKYGFQSGPFVHFRTERLRLERAH